MKISKFTIKNYKSFGSSANPHDDQVNGLSSINMVYGYNNSGKSNLLKFIHLIFQPKITRQGVVVEGQRLETESDISFWRGPITDSPFIFHKNNRDLPIEFEMDIKVTNKEIKDSGFGQYQDLETIFSRTRDFSTFVLKGKIVRLDNFDTAEMMLTECQLNSKNIYKIGNDSRPIYFDGLPVKSNLKGDSIAFSNLLSIFNSAAIFLDNNRYLGNEKLNKELIKLSPTGFKNWLHDLYLSPERYNVFEDLGVFIKKYKISPGRNNDSVFSDVEKNSPFNNFNPEFAILKGDHIELMFKRGKDRFPLSSFGTGVQQLLYILTTLFYSNSKIVLIEELELNLSPRYQSELFKILWALIEAKKIDQIFFTTHSSYFDHRADFSIYEVSINGSGVSKVTKSTKPQKNIFFKKLDA